MVNLRNAKVSSNTVPVKILAFPFKYSLILSHTKVYIHIYTDIYQGPAKWVQVLAKPDDLRTSV